MPGTAPGRARPHGTAGTQGPQGDCFPLTPNSPAGFSTALKSQTSPKAVHQALRALSRLLLIPALCTPNAVLCTRHRAPRGACTPPDAVHPMHSAVHRVLPRGWHPLGDAHPRAMPRVGTVHPGPRGVAPQPPCRPEQLGSAAGRGRCTLCNSNKIHVNKRFLVQANEMQAVRVPLPLGSPLSPREPPSWQGWGCAEPSAGL